jgi:hypothetical protein
MAIQAIFKKPKDISVLLGSDKQLSFHQSEAGGWRRKKENRWMIAFALGCIIWVKYYMFSFSNGIISNTVFGMSSCMPKFFEID